MGHLVIYFNPEKTSYQVIHPTEFFDGNWKALAEHIAGPRPFRYEVFKPKK